ncbi:MAG: BACON domain-containing protein [Prevotella sp.]|nr:BACON domain-containing protein [Prevotella sp.]
MKKKFFLWNLKMLVVLMVSGVLLASCGDDEEDDTPYVSISVAEGSEFGAGGGNKSIEVKSNGPWRLSLERLGDKPSWLQIGLAQGSGSKTFVISASKNEVAEPRELLLKVISVDNPSLTDEIVLTQAGAEPLLTVEQKTIVLKALGASKKSITVKSNAKWTASVSSSWLSISTTQGSGDGTITVAADDNDSNTERSATVTVTVGGTGLVEVVQVTQKSTQDLLYRVPYTVWGSSTADVKEYMEQYDLYREETSQLTYKGRYKEILTAYLFDRGSLIGATVVLSQADTSYEEIKNSIINDGFGNYGDVGGRTRFTSANGKTVVYLELVDDVSAYYVRYYDYNWDANLFDLPYISWGAARSSVKSIVTSRGYTLLEESTSASQNYYLAFEGKHKEAFSMYMFSAQQRLQQVSVAIDSQFASMSEVQKWVASLISCSYIGTEEGTLYYVSNDRYTAIMLSTTSLGEGLDAVVVSFADLSAILGSRATRGAVSLQTLASATKASTALMYSLLERNRETDSLENIINKIGNGK